MPDQIWASTSSINGFGIGGWSENFLTTCWYVPTSGRGGSSDGICHPAVKWFSGMSSSDWGRISGVDGVFVYVECSDAATPVAREALLSAWRISSSGIW